MCSCSFWETEQKDYEWEIEGNGGSKWKSQLIGQKTLRKS